MELLLKEREILLIKNKNHFFFSRAKETTLSFSGWPYLLWSWSRIRAAPDPKRMLYVILSINYSAGCNKKETVNVDNLLTNALHENTHRP